MQMLDKVALWLGMQPTTLVGLVWSTIIVLVYWYSHERVPRWIGRRIETSTLRYAAVNAASYGLGLITIVLLLRIWIGSGGGIVTYLGILSAGMAVALQEPIVNLAGWLFIMTRRPFQVGDRIEIAQHAGDVIDVRLFQFSLLEIRNWVGGDASTGRVIEVPNAWVFRQSISNWDRGPPFVWTEIPITVTFESNWQKAKLILHEIAERNMGDLGQEAMQRARAENPWYMITTQTHMSSIWTTIVDRGICLTMRLPTIPKARRLTESRVFEEVLSAFQRAPDIDIALPTTRAFRSEIDGKAGLFDPHRAVAASNLAAMGQQRTTMPYESSNTTMQPGQGPLQRGTSDTRLPDTHVPEEGAVAEAVLPEVRIGDTRPPPERKGSDTLRSSGPKDPLEPSVLSRNTVQEIKIQDPASRPRPPAFPPLPPTSSRVDPRRPLFPPSEDKTLVTNVPSSSRAAVPSVADVDGPRSPLGSASDDDGGDTNQ